ncbi:molybdate ABC transporter substrate-binding protein [Hyphococcus sp.]|uniref:molybdate ABC transporter substrate-binding protein n=1 Tax=Hyphococcus sp. TaxID=2038636 RepID=UPI003CCBF0F5
MFKNSRRWLRRFLEAISAVLVFMSPARAADALVAVAANFKEAADVLAADFEMRTDHTITLASGSTGKLYAQSINGAPFHVFLAADQERPALLVENGSAVAGSQFTYAAGRLALWSAEPARLANGDGEDALRAGRFRRLAIANPDLAPYGAAAKQVLQKLEIWDDVQSKIIMGENVVHSFTYAATGNAEFGFVALSSIISLNATSAIYWEPPSDLYTAIKQDAVLLKAGAANEAAAAFIDYLKGDDARAIIARLGYGTD